MLILKKEVSSCVITGQMFLSFPAGYWNAKNYLSSIDGAYVINNVPMEE